MLKRSARWMTAAVLVVAGLTACSDGPAPTEVSGPSIETSPYDTGLTIQTAMAYVQTTGASLASTESEDFGDVATAIIGEKGGTLRAGYHTLVVPPGAVGDPTWFRMEVIPGAHILVDLSAREIDDGKVDHSDPVYKFDRPLNLILSYEKVLSKSDVERLRNVYLYLDSPRYLVPLESRIDYEHKTLSSPIWHFSQYGMAIE